MPQLRPRLVREGSGFGASTTRKSLGTAARRRGRGLRAGEAHEGSADVALTQVVSPYSALPSLAQAHSHPRGREVAIPQIVHGQSVLSNLLIDFSDGNLPLIIRHLDGKCKKLLALLSRAAYHCSDKDSVFCTCSGWELHGICLRKRFMLLSNIENQNSPSC